MALTNPAACLDSVHWEEEDYYLNDFCQKYSLPQVAKITKGRYLHIGAPTLSNPSLNQMVLLAQTAKRLKVAAQCVKFKDSNRVVPVGTKLAIPDNYEGWFEILSEDGRAVRCIESVLELLKVFPDSCLVRDNIKAYLSMLDNVEVVSDKTRTVYAGETLVLVGEVHAFTAKPKFSGRYLRCLASDGESLFLSVNQKGKFSPVAREGNISGVHTIKNLLLKRLPLMVRLVHGQRPTGVKNSHNNFVPEMRLYSLFEEESIMVLPLQKDSHIVALPPSTHLKVQAPKDVEALMKLKNYGLLVNNCKNLVLDSSDKIKVFDIAMSKELRGEKTQSKKGVNIYRMNRIQSCVSVPKSEWKDKTPVAFTTEHFPNNNPGDIPNRYDEIDRIYDYIRGFKPLPLKAISCAQQGIRGDVPPSPNHRSTPSSSANTTNSTKTSATTTKSSDDDRPEPPPIETIPVRRASKCGIPPSSPKRLLKTVTDEPVEETHLASHIYETIQSIKLEPEAQNGNPEKLFISHPVNKGPSKFLMKSPAQQRIQHKINLFRHSKRSPVVRDVPVPKACQLQRNTRSKSFITSPLFNMRYKSLINLTSDFDTLDSSNSGGEASYFSGGSQDIIKRRNKLWRPKSFTDLFQKANQDHLWSYKNFENIIHGDKNRPFSFSHVSDQRKYLNCHHAKRINTLYL